MPSNEQLVQLIFFDARIEQFSALKSEYMEAQIVGKAQRNDAFVKMATWQINSGPISAFLDDFTIKVYRKVQF